MNLTASPYYGNMMQYVAGQLGDGEVERREFVPSSGGAWPVSPDEDMRKKLESFVLKNIPTAHQFEGRDGQLRVVYLDERGRSVDNRIVDVPDSELVRMARRYGMKVAGLANDDEPRTSKTNHGYSKPATESVSEAIETAPGPKKLEQIGKDFTAEAGGEKMEVEWVKGAFYIYGSELGVLRIYHKRKGAGRAQYSTNLKSWYYTPQ